ncbi:MAG: phosphoglycerate kinase [Chloroflexi bacterium]|nr:phosphoglycerate kinase [Chloroflexota bacterium]
MNKKTVRDVDVKGKTVLLRVDFNVPFEKGTTRISDDGRIRAGLPTIDYLRQQGAKVIVCSHLGRPRGKPVEELRMRPVAERLGELLGTPVAYVRECVGPEVVRHARQLEPGQVLVLENPRFYPEEEQNAPSFAKELASLAQVYVNDAFAAAHRAHASTEGVAHYLPAVAGLLMEKEVDVLGRVLEKPKRPLVAVLGGAKVSDKIAVLDHLLELVDAMLVGGGMAATFLVAQGRSVGSSLVEPERVALTAELARRARERGVELLLPRDVVVAERLEPGTRHCTVPVDGAIEDGWAIADIGPQTADQFAARIAQAGTVVWNGPLGVFEVPPFDQGTLAIARAMATCKGTTVVGGGSTAEAVESMGMADKMTHVSTGGGASLEFLEGKVLPGVAALLDK